MHNLRKYFDHVMNFDHSNINAIDCCHNMFLIGAILSKKPKNIIEIGIGTGYVTLSLVYALGYNGMGKLTCVDNWSEWGGTEPNGIDDLRNAGVEVIEMNEKDFVEKCETNKYDFLISDADPFLSGLWVDEHIRITKPNGFMFFHNTNLKDIYPNLQLIEKRIQERGLFYYHFTENSRAEELCNRGWLFAVNRPSSLQTLCPVMRDKDRMSRCYQAQSNLPICENLDDEILYLGLTVGENYGWGVCSQYLIQELSQKTSIHLLNEKDGSSTNKYLPGKLFQALTSYEFFGMFEEAKGTNNYGYTFFENELTPNSIENSKKYDLILGGSTWCRDRMAEKGIHNCDVLIQGIDPDIFYPIEDEKEDDKFVIFSGGKFELRKGQDLVLKAVKILQDKYEDIILVNSWYNIWPQSMKLMSCSKFIKFDYQEKPWLDFMNHIYELNGLDPDRIKTFELIPNKQQREIYKKTDIGLFPNRCEGGTNLVLMEYMACGKPVIASNTSGHKDILTSENSMMLTEMTDLNIADAEGNLWGRWQEPSLEQIVSHIEYAYLHRDEIRKIGKNAGRDMKMFTWKQTADQLLKIIK